MHKSKLAQTYLSLSKTEQNRFQRFINSAYHNTHPDVARLAQYLYERLGDLPNGYLYSWEDGEQHTLGTNDGSQLQKLRNVMSYLQKSLEEFLAYEHLHDSPLNMSLELLSVYQELRLDKAFNDTMDSARAMQKKSAIQNADYYYTNFSLQLKQYEFDNQKNRGEAKNLQELLDSFEVFYLANKLKFSVIALIHQAQHDKQYNLGLLDIFITSLEGSHWLNIPAIAVYYAGYKALSNEHEYHYFYELRKLLQTYQHLFPKTELRDLYVITINVGIKQVNKGHEVFVSELFDLYKEGLELGFLIENNELSRFTYKNIIASALKLGQLEWAKDFIYTYKHYLNREYRDVEFNYNLAKWHYISKNYKEATYILQTLATDDTLIVLGSKTSLLKIYFELQEWTALESLLQSFKLYIKRHKTLSTHDQSSYLNFIKYLSKLAALASESNQNSKIYNKAIQTLNQSLLDEPQLPARSWLQTQLQSLVQMVSP